MNHSFLSLGAGRHSCLRLLACLTLLFGTPVLQPISAQSQASNQWAYEMMRVPSVGAPAFSPSKPVTIAIIDDALDLQHPLWKNHLYENAREIPGNQKDDDGNGLVDDRQGWDFADNDADVNPPKGDAILTHGTAVAGLAWEMLDRLTGGNMAAFRILPIKVKADATMNNYLPFGYKGIDYAVQQGAQVIICCWSGGNYGREEEAMVKRAVDAGAILVCSAGNFFALEPQYPGAAPGCINVTGVGRSRQKHPIANYGLFADLAAPADSLYTALPFQYQRGRYLSGTSAAAPFVAATVAALLSANPKLGLATIERLLKNSATPVEAENPMYYGNLGAGLLNIERLIQDRNGEPPSRTSALPEGYLPLAQLDAQDALTVAPAGRYPGFQLWVEEASPAKKQAGMRLRLYQGGSSRDTLWQRHDWQQPVRFTADSFSVLAAGKKDPKSRGWLHYKAQTIDSSRLYCSGLQTISATKGELTDGSGALPYAGRCDCKWQLTAPEGKKIRIRFTELDTEAKIDFVYIFHGRQTNEPILAMFSGNELPPEITSWGKEVLIWFVSNDKVHGQGWKLVYEVVD